MLPAKLTELFLKHRSICTDTRKIAPGNIFFALKGPNFNGNAYAAKAIELGASAVVVDENSSAPEELSIRVEDVLKCLQELAGWYRSKLAIPVIAITGSNGKTTTKELVRDVLLSKYKVFATPGNLNNHIGLPISLLSIPEGTEIAVIEMGANHPGEIADLCSIAAPDFGFVTNAGKDHLEGFGSVEGVINSLGELYVYLRSSGGKAFVNSLETDLLPLASEIPGFHFGSDSDKIYAKVISNQRTLSVQWWENGHDMGIIRSRLAGEYNLRNILSAIAIGRYFQVEPEAIRSAVEAYNPGNNRSQLVVTKNNEVILDAYNANPSSMEVALKNLAEQRGASTFFMIGDMLEMGDSESAEHERILQLCQKLKLQGITVGPAFEKWSGKYGYLSFPNVSEAKKRFEASPFSGKVVLLKGSRGIRMEELLSVL
jgi:UDP-N-acetylmuramoyl-tripeptide--D-alanyl-D-alanine ligase